MYTQTKVVFPASGTPFAGFYGYIQFEYRAVYFDRYSAYCTNISTNAQDVSNAQYELSDCICKI